MSYSLQEEMLHLLHNLHNYIMFQVIETAWNELVADFRQASDLEQLLLAHEKYLQQIVDKALMGGPNAKVCTFFSFRGSRADPSCLALSFTPALFADPRACPATSSA